MRKKPGEEEFQEGGSTVSDVQRSPTPGPNPLLGGTIRRSLAASLKVHDVLMPLRWLSSKRHVMTSVSKDVEKFESLGFAGRSGN